MDSAWNLECIFKLLFQEHNYRNVDELISFIDSRREKTEMHNNGCDIPNSLEKVLGSIELLLKIFNSNYETRFDVFTEYIFDQIQNIIQFGIDRNILSNLPLGNIFNVIDLVLDISLSHSCKGIMTKLAKFYTSMQRAFKKDDFSSSEVEELVFNLRIISNFYVIVNKKKFENPMFDMKQLITDINDDSCESELFAKLVFSSSKVIAAQTLINVIPAYMEFSGNNTILQFISDKISHSLAGNNYEISKIFIVLCYLSDVYFAAENKKLIHDIFECNCYWVLLQKGLIHSDSCVRKQALFLLKKSCHYLRDNQISWIKQDDGVSNISKTSEKHIVLLKCDWNAMFDIFSELWCIIEYLEETQVHLLKPIIDVIDCFTARNKEKLDISWILIIIQRMISHDNMTIIRKGFLNMLNISISDYHNEEILAHAVKLLVSTLKCTQMYSLDWQVVVDELSVYFNACSRQGNGKEFFKLLLNEIANERWGPEALFFVTYALQPVQPKSYWGKNELDLIKKILNGTVNHYTYMKSATQGQLLNIAINFLVSHDVTLDDVASLVTCFFKSKCLVRKNNLWNKIVKWIRDSYETEDVEKYLEKSISDHTGSVNIGKMILILYDAYSCNREMTQKITNLLRDILVTFASVNVRPYFDAGTQEFNLSIVCDFMEESSGDYLLMNILRPLLPDILRYIEMKLDCSYHIRDFEKSQDLLRRLDTVLNFCKSDDHAALEVINKWFEKITKNLVIKPVEFLPLQKFLQIKILTVIIANNVCLVSHRQMEFVAQFLRSGLCAPLEKTAEDSIATEDLQKLWGKMNSEYLRRKWELLSYVTGSPLHVLQISSSDFIRLCLDAIDTGGAAVLLPLLNALGKALPSLLQEPQLTQMMDSIFDLMMERKKNDDFYQLVKAYIEVTFQLDVVSTREENIREMLLEHSRQLLSENNVNIANAFIKHVQKLKLVTGGKYFLLDLLPRALLFGQIQRKDERLISDICAFIEKKNISPLTNDFSTNVEVRARAINIVLTLDGRCEDNRKFAEDLIDALIKFEENVNKNKTRYFADSNAHRYKERLMQSLLVLVELISKVKAAELWTWLYGKLLENNQPSVRYLQEWLMLRLIYKNRSLEDRLWLYFDKCKDKTRSLCSFISVAYHSLSHVFMPVEKVESRIETVLRTFLPYCMAQHFSVRLYAQVTLQRLMNIMEAPVFSSVREKYGVVSEILTESIRSGNAVKNCSKMLEDFYFTEFNPVSHYTLETIFYEFPRLTSAGSQELIPISLFEKYGLDKKNCIIPVGNSDDSLKRFTYGKWIVDGSNQIDIFVDSEENKDIELSNLQKKMIPIKYLVPDVEDLLQFASYSGDDKNKEGLIVVGSLIDRLPNLGGLSRTCEVFGASEFVIGSLKYLEDQQFKSLSVTAEKWIPITEVKPYHLSEYLAKMKLNGYTILAAEQTVNSQPLGSVKFPKKSILLLGNEKEGIPPTLLPLMDICVEIPQNGIIRSLNVHVTGALFIWEYAKQHNSFTRI